MIAVCKKCDTETMPTKDFVHIPSVNGNVNMDRYVCKKCSWIWATEEQRKGNRKRYHKAIKLASNQNRMWF